MKVKAFILMAVGVLGSIFILTFDWIMRKPVNDITGPISTPGLILCGLLVIFGVLKLTCGCKCKGK